MAHFAKIENGIVRNVIVLGDSDCGGGVFPESEPIGQAYIDSLGFDGEWLQTSYNRNFRGLFAGVGMNWDGVCFHDDAPFDSWVLDQSTGEWSAPTDRPQDGKDYIWDEDAILWIEVTI